VLKRLETITNPVERFTFFRVNRAEIIAEFRQRQLSEKRDVRTDIEKRLSRGVANAAETAEVLKLSSSMLSQVRSGTRFLSAENMQLLKLLTK